MGAARADDVPVVRLEPNLPGASALVANRRLPAGQSFVVELATPSDAGSTAVIDIWPRIETKDCTPGPTGSTKQRYRLAMTPQGDGAARVLRATVPPLQIDERFCYLITPASSLPGFIVDAWAGRLANDYTDTLDATSDTDKAAAALHAAVAALRIEMPSVTGNVTGFVTQVEIATGQSDLVKRFREDKELLVATTKALAAKTVTAAVMTQVTTKYQTSRAQLVAMVKTAATTAASNLRIQSSLEFQTNLGDSDTAPMGSHVSPDFGVALAAPLAGGARSPWLVPYLGASFYLARVDRDIPISQLVGPTLRQRLSVTFGLSMTAPGIDGRTVDPIMFDKYPVVGIGLRLSPYVKVGVVSLLYFVHDRNPASAGRTLGVAPALTISIDADVLQYLEKSFGEK